jgi:hypothetical protein
MNQHNPLYNSKAKLSKPVLCEYNPEEEIRKELIFTLQSRELHRKALEYDSEKTKQYINSWKTFDLIRESARSRIFWQFSKRLCGKEVDLSHMEKNIQKSRNQLGIIRKLEELRKTNKLWHKLKDEEKEMLNKMSLNCYKGKLSYESVRKVVKKEMWKRALDEIKLLTHKEDAIKAKQLLFYFRFGSSNKKANKNYLAQLKDETIMDLYDMENTSKGLVKKEYVKGLRIARQYQIKEIYWKQNAQSSTVNVKRRIFDNINNLNAKLAYLNSSGKNQNTKEKLAGRFRKIMDDEQFAKLNRACSRQDNFKIVRLMEKLQLHHDADNIWKYFQSFEIEKKKQLNWDAKNRMVKTCRWIYVNRAQLANKLKVITK